MLASLVSALVYLVVLVIVLLGLLVAWKGGRGAAVWLLDIYRRFNLAVLAFRGDTPASEAERRVVSGQAWLSGATRSSPPGRHPHVAGRWSHQPLRPGGGLSVSIRLVRGSLENHPRANLSHAPTLVSLAMVCATHP